MKKLNELFQVTYGNKFDLNKLSRLPRSQGGVSLVGRSEKNHGVSATVAPVPGVAPYPPGLITVALGGTKLLCSFVQEHPFYTAQNVAVLRPLSAMSFAQMVYMCVCIRANRFRYGAFGREANRTLRTLLVPDVKDFPCWVESDGGAVTADFSAPARPQSVALRDPGDWTEFLMGEIFDIRKGARLTKAEQQPGPTPYIGAIDRNNGLSNRISQSPMHLGGTVSVNYNGSVAEAFFQPEPFWASDDVNVLYAKKGSFEPEVGLFIAAVIRREKYRFSYGRKWGLERMVKTSIRLPSRELPGGKRVPDWTYMKRFMLSRPFSSRLNTA